ncbi:hypothetical protein DFH09DRAFT_1330159 [Mycena vulgaris]|nr:hypothetical protein DFH09DRAFT_1330159 [Mycena vulgaris]
MPSSGFKRKALSAARGSTKDLLFIDALMRNISDDNPDLYFSSLPAASTFDDAAVNRALISLEHIFTTVVRVTFHPDVFRELWSRAWKWVQWVDSYQDHVVDYDDRATGAGFLDFTRASGITETSDLRGCDSRLSDAYSRRAWIVVHKNHNSLRAALGLGALSQLLFSRMRPKNLEHVDEIIEGSGGSLSHLASLVVKFIDEFDPDSESLMLKQDARLRGHIFEFIDDIDRFLGPRERDATIAGPFSVALLSAGIISSILTMATGLIKPNPENPPFSPLVEKSLAFLNRMLLTMPEHHWCSDAIDAGLLQVIISCSAAEKFQKTMRSLLDDVLPASLIHYYGLQVVEDELVEAMKLAKGLNFRSVSLLKEWKSFVDLVRERLGRARSFDDTWKQRLKSCDNAQCGKIGHSSLFGRCSGCQAFYYCSPKCQAWDWTEGNHQRFCNPQRSLRLSANDELGVRERTFRRALLSHDYNVAKYDHIYPAQALLLACDPRAAFLTLFDYRRGRATIEVQLLSDSEVVQSFSPDSDWPNEVARAVRSAGRTELHVMAIASGAQTRYFVVPFRKETSGTHEMVVRVARNFTGSATIEDVRSAVAKEDRVMELATH